MSRAFAYSAFEISIAHTGPELRGGLRFGYIVSAASMYDGVAFNHTRWLDTSASA